MEGFEEGYKYFSENAGAGYAAEQGGEYVKKINDAIDEFIKQINEDLKGVDTPIDKLKGDAAEYWHGGTFNIDAAVHESGSRVFVNRVNDRGSADISSNFGQDFGLKYYKNGASSAKEQAKTVYEKYKENGGKLTLDEFMTKNGYDRKTALETPLYQDQIRIIPKGQLDDAREWLKRKITEESSKRPEQAARYEETLKMLDDRIRDSKGNESIPLSTKEAEELARQAKEGGVDPKRWGLTTENLITTEDILRVATKAGLSSGVLSMVLKAAPDIISAIEYLIQTGKIDKEKLKNAGLAAVSGFSEGFVIGTVSASITEYCAAGMLGESLKGITPGLVSSITVLAVHTIENSYKVATHKMSGRDMADDTARSIAMAGFGYAGGVAMQTLLPALPAVGYLIGSMVGSITGAFAYTGAKTVTVAICKDTGFTMFGLVEQDYSLPDDILKDLGIETADFETADVCDFEFEDDNVEQPALETASISDVSLTVLRRGVVSASRVAYQVI